MTHTPLDNCALIRSLDCGLFKREVYYSISMKNSIKVPYFIESNMIVY